MGTNKDDYIQMFIEKFLIPKIGIKPFNNLNDIRNRKKVFKTINEVFEKKLKLTLTEEEVKELEDDMLKKYKMEEKVNV